VQEGAHGERASGRIKREVLEERAKLSAPFQPDVPHGERILLCQYIKHIAKGPEVISQVPYSSETFACGMPAARITRPTPASCWP
jgi:hypothetical protein